MHKINRASPEKHEYLQIMHSIDDSIKSLYFIGSLPESRIPTVAIVGTRRPTSYGKEVAYKLSYDLASRGVLIMSGLALGIDAIAHRAALDAGGRTIAILGNGVDSITPTTNRDLGERIITNGGAIMSEYEPGTSAKAYTFLQRNRIVSGLSDALLIVEAADRSGTLNTASHALSQGKLLCAVPGNITSLASTGCNRLIRQGATPITSASDMIEELGIVEPGHATQQAMVFGDSVEEESILSLMRDGIRDGFALQSDSKLDPATFNQTLTMLEIKGTVKAIGANQWSL